MGIETSLAGRQDKELFKFPKKNNPNSKVKKNRRQKKMLPVQKLFETCKEVFANSGPGVVPSPENIELLRSVLDDMKPADVGLSPDLPYFRTVLGRRTPKIAYLHLHECDNFSIGIFCLPPSGVIPLHNHPGMTVFSKLLFGTMHIKSYDWVRDAPYATSIGVNPSQAATPGVRLAKVKVDTDFTAPCNTSILYPADGGNLHRFTALTACAVLDVLGPPYSEPDGRHCTYYFDIPFPRISVDGVVVPKEEEECYAWLQEREKPEDLEVVGAKYRGPKIVES